MALMAVQVKTPAWRQVHALAVRELPEDGHERATHHWVADTVARLLALPYAGLAGPDERDAASYFVPDDTLDAVAAAALGISGSEQLLGGVVPFPFVATKVIAHPLVPGAQVAIAGWDDALAQAVAADTLPGYSAFCTEDAVRAYTLLRAAGQVRLKLPTGVGGRGQWLLQDEAGLHAALATLSEDYLPRHGVVLETHLVHLTTFSVGEVALPGRSIAYHGTQVSTPDREGRQVYGGSDLQVVRGSLAQLQQGELPPAERQAVRAAHAFDRKLRQAFPQAALSRRNYDVAYGEDAAGRMHCGVLEQSWRVGGATPAELAAFEAFARDPAVTRVHAATRELHGQPAPAGARLYYAGDDPRLGPLVKFLTVSAA
ncbi:MAG TPA: DUF3182 family protein [Stenotrophomonas sp.]|nr:DUF3182 family protein [Stenotrophomonas sp.]